MQDYTLFFENDAARMDLELQQYEFLQPSTHLTDQLAHSILDPPTIPPPTQPQVSLNTQITEQISLGSTHLCLKRCSRRGQRLKTLSLKSMGFIVQPDPNRKKKPILKKINKYAGSFKQDQYPTKNFLQNFKGAHLDYLRKFFSREELNRYAIIQKIKGKNSMSRSLYASLYMVADFEEVFRKMFAQRYLFRAMMLSRSETTAKKNHFKKINVLQKAFFSKSFLKIN